jgi:hydroxymethylbilane synthase
VTPITTKGDRVLDTPLPVIGGKGLFTLEIEAALRDGAIDLAVHSLKDLPTEPADGIVIGAIPARADAADVLIARDGGSLDELPQGARIGTSSPRRAAQLKRHRPDVAPSSIRGNIETRIRKGDNPDNGFDAIVLAAAGLDRLDLAGRVTQRLPFEIMLPAPGQGALAVQCRQGDPAEHLVAAINDLPSALAVSAERAFLSGLGGGCSAPIAALGTLAAGELRLDGRVLSNDGATWLDVSLHEPCPDLETARALGSKLAEIAIRDGLPIPLERLA